MIDFRELTALCGFADLETFQRAHCQWVEQALNDTKRLRDDRWSESIAVGSLFLVESVKSELGVKVLHREFEQFGGAYALREPSELYAADLDAESNALGLKNTIAWDENAETAETERAPTHETPSGRRANLKKALFRKDES